MIRNSTFFYADAGYYFDKISDHAENGGKTDEPMKRTNWTAYVLNWLKKDEANNLLVGDDGFIYIPSSSQPTTLVLGKDDDSDFPF
jgi:hypothetical protein